MEVERDAEYFDYHAGLSKYASASRFVDVKHALHKPNSGNDPRRGHQPSSWSFYRGLQRGRIETPPLPFFLSTVNGAFFLMLRKKAGLKRSPHAARADKVSPFG